MRHVAIILDGNRRWAKERGLGALEGHNKGLGSFEVVARHAADRGIEHLSLWGSSLDNLSKRSNEEVAWLLRVFRREFLRLAEDDEIHERQTKVRAFGRWREKFPGEVVAAIEVGIHRIILCIALIWRMMGEYGV
jgi:undecaprenyl diphosphate synthase